MNASPHFAQNDNNGHAPDAPFPIYSFRFADDEPFSEPAPVLDAPSTSSHAFAPDARISELEGALVEHLSEELDARFANVPSRDEISRTVNDVVWEVVTPLLQSVANLEASNAALRAEMGELLEGQQKLSEETRTLGEETRAVAHEVVAVTQPVYNSEQLMRTIDRLVSQNAALETELSQRPKKGRSKFLALLGFGGESKTPIQAESGDIPT
jgi:hypothetical protein